MSRPKAAAARGPYTGRFKILDDDGPPTLCVVLARDVEARWKAEFRSLQACLA